MSGEDLPWAMSEGSGVDDSESGSLMEHPRFRWTLVSHPRSVQAPTHLVAIPSPFPKWTTSDTIFHHGGVGSIGLLPLFRERLTLFDATRHSRTHGCLVDILIHGGAAPTSVVRGGREEQCPLFALSFPIIISGLFERYYWDLGLGKPVNCVGEWVVWCVVLADIDRGRFDTHPPTSTNIADQLPRFFLRLISSFAGSCLLLHTLT